MPPKIKQKFDAYPQAAKDMLMEIRQLILAVAAEQGMAVEETLKWGQPSYLVKGGSTIRYDWSAKSPTHVKLFFNCKTQLVETFREIYAEVFEFEGNRVILFKLSDTLPKTQLRHCILMAFTYHKIKHLPLMGA